MKYLTESRFCLLEVVVVVFTACVASNLIDAYRRHARVENHKQIEIEKSFQEKIDGK